MDQKVCINEVIAERDRQIAKWGGQSHEPATWMLILGEEVGELSEAILHDVFGGKKAGTSRKELIQIAAVALAMLEDDKHFPI